MYSERQLQNPQHMNNEFVKLMKQKKTKKFKKSNNQYPSLKNQIIEVYNKTIDLKQVRKKNRNAISVKLSKKHTTQSVNYHQNNIIKINQQPNDNNNKAKFKQNKINEPSESKNQQIGSIFLQTTKKPTNQQNQNNKFKDSPGSLFIELSKLQTPIKVEHKQTQNATRRVKSAIKLASSSSTSGLDLANIKTNQLQNTHKLQKTFSQRFKEKLQSSKTLIQSNKIRLLQSQTQFRLQRQIKQNLQLSTKQQQLNDLIMMRIERLNQHNDRQKKKREEERFVHQNKVMTISIMKTMKSRAKEQEIKMIKMKSEECELDMVFSRLLKQKQAVEKQQKLVSKLQLLKGRKLANNKCQY